MNPYTNNSTNNVIKANLRNVLLILLHAFGRVKTVDTENMGIILYKAEKLVPTISTIEKKNAILCINKNSLFEPISSTLFNLYTKITNIK